MNGNCNLELVGEKKMLSLNHKSYPLKERDIRSFFQRKRTNFKKIKIYGNLKGGILIREYERE